MKKLIFVGIIFIFLSKASNAELLGSELSLKAIFQSSPSSLIQTIGFPTSVIVSEPEIEFPSLDDLDIEGDGFNVVDVSINVGDDFIEIDFSNVSSHQFSPAFENTYVFTFDKATSVNITGAEIDTLVTTLGLTASDIRFIENKLFINVESLSFNSSTFVRINLRAEENPLILDLQTIQYCKTHLQECGIKPKIIIIPF